MSVIALIIVGILTFHIIKLYREVGRVEEYVVNSELSLRGFTSENRSSSWRNGESIKRIVKILCNACDKTPKEFIDKELDKIKMEKERDGRVDLKSLELEEILVVRTSIKRGGRVEWKSCLGRDPILLLEDYISENLSGGCRPLEIFNSNIVINENKKS